MTSGTVRPTLLLRLLMGLVVAPLLLIGGILISINVLFPLIFPNGVSLATAATMVVAAIALYYAFALFFELDLASWVLARAVGWRWTDRVRAARAPWRYLFYLDG